MLVTRAMCRVATPLAPGPGLLQTEVGGDPWRVAACSVLLCRCSGRQARASAFEMFRRWPTAGDLARSDTAELEAVLRPCGLHRQRARQLQRMSSLYLGDGWELLVELPGVGVYVNDAVAVLCFGSDAVPSNDVALLQFVEGRRCA